ncbi:hypothetical protein ScalyP_jg5921 [Parmales sp. scaly parma]|nr:hypothetical protein ScalyP_jg5921 [Parmales sp. scaly parma]
MTSEDSSTFYRGEKNLNALCNFLRATGPSVKEAVMRQGEKRVYYLKGEKLLHFLVIPKKGRWDAKIPRVENREQALVICKELLKMEYIARVTKEDKGIVSLDRNTTFDEDGYFVWVYEGDTTKRSMMTVALMTIFLACTCFPLWPQFVKVWVWYLSVTMLIILFIYVTFRAALYLFCWGILGYDFWLTPNLFDEELGFIDSFIPGYSIEKSKAGQIYWRVAILVGFGSFCYYAVTQPSEFDGMLASQKSFLDDLYSGNLLTDMSQQSKEDIDKPKIKSLDDLLSELDAVDIEEEDVAEAILNKIMDDEFEAEEAEEAARESEKKEREKEAERRTAASMGVGGDYEE